MSQAENNNNPEARQLPLTLDFGGPLGRPPGIVPPGLRDEIYRRRRDPKPNLPEPPGNVFGQKPPDQPSLF